MHDNREEDELGLINSNCNMQALPEKSELLAFLSSESRTALFLPLRRHQWLIWSMRVDPKFGDLRTERNFRLVAHICKVEASYLQSGSHEWYPSGRPRRTYNLLFVITFNLKRI